LRQGSKRSSLQDSRGRPASAISSFTHWLLTNGEDGEVYYQRLRRDPARLPTAVEELLRVLPVGADDGFPRRALQDVRLGADGVLIRAGELVIPSHDAANYDVSRFTDAEEVDLSRSPNPHLSFGYGPHYCLGEYVTRLEINAALGALFERVPTLALAVPENDLQWNDATSIGAWYISRSGGTRWISNAARRRGMRRRAARWSPSRSKSPNSNQTYSTSDCIRRCSMGS
jgi:cytochrome P450